MFARDNYYVTIVSVKNGECGGEFVEKFSLDKNSAREYIDIS
jgi:hypothetical protein